MNDQNIIPLFIAGSLLLTLFAFFLIAYLLVQKRKQNKYYLEKQQMVFDHETNILRTKLEEKENTMIEISRELHDNININLRHASWRMYNVEKLATDHEQVALIDEANKIIMQAMGDLQDISHSLNSNLIKETGLVGAITNELEHLRLSKNMTYDLEVQGATFPLQDDNEGKENKTNKELHVYRIAQEAIQNCVKHAQATNINFILSYEPGLFTMKITDNGIGFDTKKINERKGLGFLNMFQRATHIHGSLDIQSTLHQGTNITLTINLDIKDGENN